MRSPRAIIHALLVLACCVCASTALCQRSTYTAKELGRGFKEPWELRLGYDGWLYFTQKHGTFSKMNLETHEVKQLLIEPECVYWGEAGMLSFDFHPRYPDSPYVYIAAIMGTTDLSYGLYRYTMVNDSLVDRVLIFGPTPASYVHNGSRVLCNGEHIYFTQGELWQFEIAQDVWSPQGKVNRIKLDGSIPEDNPFPHYATWTFGHRNPQGLDLAPDGTLYSSEHGEDTDDEVNIIERGRNYGWPIVQGYCDSASDHPNCEDLNIREPIAAFTPTLATGDIAYISDPHFPEWRHSLLLATLKNQALHQFNLSPDGQSILSHERYELVDEEGEPIGRLRSICVTKDGRIFFSTGWIAPVQNKVDRIFELIRTGVEPSQVILESPQMDESINRGSIALTWLKSFWNAKYEVELSNTADFSSPMLLQQESADTSLRTALLKPNSQYFWRVREVISGGPWSEIRSFKTESILAVESKTPERFAFDVVSRPRSIGLISRSISSTMFIEVHDALGRLRHTASISDLPLGAERSLGTFDPGVYFVRVVNEAGTQTKRVLVH
jgi:aldose sugar dehydrogenase